jgi:hypothetical protein
MRSGGIDPLILTLSTRWGMSDQFHCPATWHLFEEAGLATQRGENIFLLLQEI